MLAGGQPQADEQMRLAGARVPEQDDWLAGVDPCSGGEGCEGGGDAGDGVGVEVGQPLDAGETGFGDAAGPAAFGAVVDLGGQDLGEVGQVGLRSRTAISASRAASARTVGSFSSRAAAPMAARAAVSDAPVTGCSPVSKAS